MFDIGISELGVIAVVALIVIGPERLPRVARTVGTLLGRAQRYVNDVKAEVNREIELEELKKLQTQMQDAARGIQQQVSSAGAEVHSAVHDMEKSFQTSVDSVTNESPVPGPSPTTAVEYTGLPELTEPPAELSTALPAELSTVLPAELPTVLPAELPTVLPAELPTVLPTELSTVLPTEPPTEPATEPAAELSTRLPGEPPVKPLPADSSHDKSRVDAPAQSSLFP